MSEELLKYLTRQNPIFGGKAKKNIITMETCHGSLLSLFFFKIISLPAGNGRLEGLPG